MKQLLSFTTFALLALGISGCSKQPTAGASPSHADAAAAAPIKRSGLELFGTTLQQAERENLRNAIKAAGLNIEREDGEHPDDIYKVNGVLDGARKLTVTYTKADNRFASAEYQFPAFVDTAMIGKVRELVSHKYGQPHETEGNEGVGPVTHFWRWDDGMAIKVSRSWPDTTTYLTLLDIERARVAKQEQLAQRRALKEQRAEAQSHAF